MHAMTVTGHTIQRALQPAGGATALPATPSVLLLSARPAPIPHSWLLAALLPSQAVPSPVKHTVVWATPLVVVTAMVAIAARSSLVGRDVCEPAVVTMHAALQQKPNKTRQAVSHVCGLSM